jgi:GNAT superfamily N-acetyltransferase
MDIPSASLVLRPMTAVDIPTGLQLSQAAGWNQTAADWEMLLQHSPTGSLVACLDGSVVGTVTVISYQQSLHWVGMMLVAEAHRRQGIGRALLTAALQAVAGRGLVGAEEYFGLDATPAGKPLYTSLGFREVFSLARFLRQPGQEISRSNLPCKPLTPQKIPALQPIDFPIFGADRSGILAELHHRAPHLAFYVEEDRRIVGYCLGRTGRLYTQIGPLVADRLEIACALLLKALNCCADQEVILDIPFIQQSWQPAWILFLNDLGFNQRRPFTRMVLGKFRLPVDYEKQFAIAGPELG